MSSTAKFFIGGAVVVAVIAALIATSFSGSTSDYLQIAAIKALGPDQARDSRVSGAIVPNTVEWSTRDMHLTFVIEDDTGDSFPGWWGMTSERNTIIYNFYIEQGLSADLRKSQVGSGGYAGVVYAAGAA